MSKVTMKKKPTVINSFEQLNEVLPQSKDGNTISLTQVVKDYVAQEQAQRAFDKANETKRVSLLAKSKRRY